MATLKIPATNLKFYESKQVPAIKNRVTDVIEAKYGNIIKNVSKITEYEVMILIYKIDLSTASLSF